MCIICENNYDGSPSELLSNDLVIYKCLNIVNIPIIKGLYKLTIYDCPNLVNIPSMQDLIVLTIIICPNLVSIPNINTLKYLSIDNCPNLVSIPNINTLYDLTIRDCKKFNNINNDNKIIKYLNVLKIQQWFKRMKYLKSKRMFILWEIAEYYTIQKYKPELVLKYLNLE